MKRTAAVAVCGWLALASMAAQGQSVEVFSAGSLRGVVSELAEEARPLGIVVKASFGGSGLMRERIEKGAKPDLLLSADLASPEKLEAQHRTVLPVIAFARNRMCIVSRRSAGLTHANLIDRLLAPGVKLKTSQPVGDPSGDYAWAIIDKINALHPGAGAILKQRAQASFGLTAKPAHPGENPVLALFASHQVDVAITYCSGARTLKQEAPELASIEVPPALDPHPVDGVAVLSARPEVLKLVLYLLSQKGQAILARQGLVPLLGAPR